LATERTPRRTVRALLAGALLLVLLAPSACSWNRRVVNEELLRLDFDSVQPGRTTLGEVVMRFGLPPEDEPEEIGIRALSGDHIDYTTLDERCTVFGLVTFVVVTPFRWCSGVRSYEVSLEFDPQGVVERVTTTRRRGYWPPFWNEHDTPPAVTTIRTAEDPR
jgi:hypothetical protein